MLMDERIVRAETKIDNLEERIELNEKRLDCHGREIDELNKIVNTMDKDLALLTQTSNNTLDNTRDIKEEIKAIRQLRDKDHLEKPVSTFTKRQEQIISIIIGALATYLLYQALPFLN